jgi:hypothetical protein
MNHHHNGLFSAGTSPLVFSLFNVSYAITPQTDDSFVRPDPVGVLRAD